MNSSLCEVQIIFINVVNYCEELSRWLVAAHSTMANMSAECSVTSSSCSHAHAANINLDHTNTSCYDARNTYVTSYQSENKEALTRSYYQ